MRSRDTARDCAAEARSVEGSEKDAGEQAGARQRTEDGLGKSILCITHGSSRLASSNVNVIPPQSSGQPGITAKGEICPVAAGPRTSGIRLVDFLPQAWPCEQPATAKPDCRQALAAVRVRHSRLLAEASDRVSKGSTASARWLFASLRGENVKPAPPSSQALQTWTEARRGSRRSSSRQITSSRWIPLAARAFRTVPPCSPATSSASSRSRHRTSPLSGDRRLRCRSRLRSR